MWVRCGPMSSFCTSEAEILAERPTPFTAMRWCPGRTRRGSSHPGAPSLTSFSSRRPKVPITMKGNSEEIISPGWNTSPGPAAAQLPEVSPVGAEGDCRVSVTDEPSTPRSSDTIFLMSKPIVGEPSTAMMRSSTWTSFGRAAAPLPGRTVEMRWCPVVGSCSNTIPIPTGAPGSILAPGIPQRTRETSRGSFVAASPSRSTGLAGKEGGGCATVRPMKDPEGVKDPDW
mmetsp:Transcript_64296/g.153370  ORF Transcript_64296/g.153370 Transcript_64296/m.153370 type:complete len:229 (-) Transcript_64296:603-1289(-)